ncbi:hypothetical protein HPB47_022509 [Ixodes persulcatus]|uniref:Uncharacterized protein n=1 Tax=Ixodes persulcatus TaxID=34615 RepID=A0AC60QCS1_IXOPE|nr:hypothetical protein HPB47_022509 [Ixodes persulcatus]
MASLFDQYEEVTSQSAGYLSSGRSAFPELNLQTGYINACLEDEAPMFKKTRITFTPSQPLTHLVASNQMLVLAMAHKALLRIDLRDPNHPDVRRRLLFLSDETLKVIPVVTDPAEIDLNRSLGDKGHSARIYQMFLDPLGKHLFVSLVQSESDASFDNYYLRQNAAKALSIQKLKVYQLSHDTSIGPIMGLEFRHFNSGGAEPKCFVVVSTPRKIRRTPTQNQQRHERPTVWRTADRRPLCYHCGEAGHIYRRCPYRQLGLRGFHPNDPHPRRIYQFVGLLGSPGEQPMLLKVFNTNDDVLERCKEIPSRLRYSVLQLWSQSPQDCPTKFAFMLEPGVYFGDILVPSLEKDSKRDSKTVIFNPKLLEYLESARIYAKTCASFEEVSLKFLQHAEEDNEEALRASVFLKDCVSNNRSAVYKLISKHGEENILIDFANIMKDFERVIQYHLQNKNFVPALEVLMKQNDVELVYQFSPTLMQCIPKKTVDMWMTWNARERRLDPARLIPALVQNDNTRDKTQGYEAIRYLEFCVNKLGNHDEAIHNYLLALYARLEPEKLMKYLLVEGHDQVTVPYDLKYALRVCSELGLTEACVHIYSTMELYEEAVDLALKVDIELAKTNANMPGNNEELKKKLWLKIAEHVVKEEKDIKRAMEFLQECDLIKIEDILPFFDEFVTIDHFKDAICSSLQEYNMHIEELKVEMEDATQSAKEIRSEIQAFRNKFSVVRADQKCAVCEYAVMNQAFYMFPCGHMFHADCLSSEVQQHLTPTKVSRIDDIHRQLASLGGHDDNVSLSSTSGIPTLSTRDKLMNELDDLIASECLFCGELAIRSVDEPFVDPERYEEVMRDWR